MKTKSILLLVLIASAMIKVFVYFCICLFVSVLTLAMIQDQALVSSKHFLVETEDNNLADNVKGYIPKPRVGYGPKYTGGTDFFNVIGFFRTQQHVHCPKSEDKSKKPKSFRKFGCGSLELMVHFCRVD